MKKIKPTKYCVIVWVRGKTEEILTFGFDNKNKIKEFAKEARKMGNLCVIYKQVTGTAKGAV